MHKKFEINRTKIKGDCHLGRKMVTHNSKSDLPLAEVYNSTLVLTFQSLRNVPSLHLVFKTKLNKRNYFYTV